MRQLTGNFMKLLRHTCIEGCPMQADAACMTGASLARGMPRTNGRVTTERSAAVTRPQSGLLGRWAYYTATEVARIFIGENEA